MNPTSDPSSTARLERPRIPDHELLRLIGRGSYGQVWLARNVMGAFRAVKVVSRSAFPDKRPYEREFEGVRKFEPISRTHPGLVQVLHVGRSPEGDSFYCIMEVADDLAAGQQIDPARYEARTLRAILEARTSLPVEETLRLGIELAAALGHLHRQGLVHRDIKPTNIIFVRGVPKFADIGLVTELGEKASFVGTDGYLPPEGPGTASADLFALGKVLYEAGLGLHATAFPELPTDLRQRPEAAQLFRLNELLLKACDPHPSKRFQSAQDLAEALRAQLPTTRLEPVEPGSPGADGSLRGTEVTLLFYPTLELDLRLARTLRTRLQSLGVTVWADEAPGGDLAWARRLEARVGASQMVVILASAAALANEWFAYGVEIAHQAAQRPSKPARLLPVRLRWAAPWPRFFSVAFGSAPELSWQGDADDQALEEAILQALADQGASAKSQTSE